MGVREVTKHFTDEEINESGIMAGMTHVEIGDFMDEEFQKVLMLFLGDENHDKIGHLRWLMHNAIMYTHSDGIHCGFLAAVEHYKKEMHGDHV